jgi:hypothetical protein
LLPAIFVAPVIAVNHQMTWRKSRLSRAISRRGLPMIANEPLFEEGKINFTESGVKPKPPKYSFKSVFR